jgi:phosphoribosylformylglycinamidine cyclo-ligase
MAEKHTYKSAGVNNEAKEDVSRILYEAARQTWQNRKGKLGEVIVPFDDFSGIRAIDVSRLPQGTLMGMGFDGIGTKVMVAQMLNKHNTIARDLFAMVCDDAVVRGAEPVLVGSILDVNSLKGGEERIKQVRELAKGYVDAAKMANVAVFNGETAELGSLVGGYGSFNYNWGAAVVWFARKERMFTGREIKEGDSLVGLCEPGFRANGLSLARKIMKDKHGERWHEKVWKHGLTFGEAVLTPSVIYCAAVVDTFGGYCKEPKTEVHGVAHITGGGLPEKLKRVLKPSGLGADVDTPFEVRGIMKHVQEQGNVSDREAYKTWNMGQGMVIVTPKNTEVEVQKIAAEHGIPCQTIGRVVRKPGIRIRNRGAYCDKEPELIFD